jgi:thioredoxin reductase (NADPH)
MNFDVIIIGLGSAGAAAALYCRRAGLSTAVFEGYAPGGQVTIIDKIENYPGYTSIEGYELASKFVEQTINCGAEIIYEQVTSIDLESKIIITSSGTYTSRAIIICGGAKRRTLGIEGEDKLVGRGISYCAVCDGSFYRGKTVAVVGGNDTAIGDAIYLSRLCEKVYLIHWRNVLRATKSRIAQIEACNNIETVYNSRVKSFITDSGKLSGIYLDTEGVTKELKVDGLFVALGTKPDTSLFSGLELDKSGYIITNEHMETSVPLVYAAGDIRAKEVRQIVTAAADGAIAAIMCSEKLEA